MLKEIIQIIIHGFIAYEIFTNIKKLLFKILVLANYMLLILSYIVLYYYQNITIYNLGTFFILINITLYLYVELILKKRRMTRTRNVNVGLSQKIVRYDKTMAKEAGTLYLSYAAILPATR